MQGSGGRGPGHQVWEVQQQGNMCSGPAGQHGKLGQAGEREQDLQFLMQVIGCCEEGHHGSGPCDPG